MSVRGGWDPHCHQRHSVRSQGTAALTSAPAEFRRVTGESRRRGPSTVTRASDRSAPSSSEGPHRLQPGLVPEPPRSIFGGSMSKWERKTDSGRRRESSGNCFGAAMKRRRRPTELQYRLQIINYLPKCFFVVILFYYRSLYKRIQ